MSSLVEKLSTLRTIIRQNGGIKVRTDELKWGTLVGTDKFGNKYYENNKYFVGRNRWVVYSNRFGWDYEGSQVPPEWHRWLHYMTDENPVSHPPMKVFHTKLISKINNKRYASYFVFR
ncbi:unnamed protein product [Trichobilharzia regenti]|nr:unnamed protein product [Trichobilharzia regenti]